nr:hypothetical protein [uncultured Bacteroides sp.]
MNNIKRLLYIGDAKVTAYQKTIVAVAIMVELFLGIIAIIAQNQYYKYFPVITLIPLLVILFFYSKLYVVSCDFQKFYVRNMFKRKVIEKDRFIEIRKVKFMDFLQFVVFENEKFLILKTSANYFKNIFKSPDIVANELTRDIKKFIS